MVGFTHKRREARALAQRMLHAGHGAGYTMPSWTIIQIMMIRTGRANAISMAAAPRSSREGGVASIIGSASRFADESDRCRRRFDAGKRATGTSAYNVSSTVDLDVARLDRVAGQVMASNSPQTVLVLGRADHAVAFQPVVDVDIGTVIGTLAHAARSCH